MNIDFGQGLNPADPLTVEQAVQRGSLFINVPISFVIGGGFLLGALVFKNSPFVLVPGVVAFVLAWLWWSYAIPRWRRWAIRRGVDPDELQRAAQFKLVWPRGWIFEKTEFRVSDENTSLRSCEQFR